MKISDLQTSKTKNKNPDTLPFWQRELKMPFASGIFGDKLKETFYSELSILLDSGLDLRSAIELLSDSFKSKKLKIQFEDLISMIIAGETLSDAMQKKKLISDYEFYSLQIGEETGKTAIILKELGLFFQNKVKQRQILIKAISYPIVVTATAILAIVFMLSFVVPLFAGIFQRMGEDLPFITQLILNLSNWFSDYSLILFLTLTLFILTMRFLRKKIWFKSFFGYTMLKLPFVGEFLLLLHLSRFCNSMALLLSSGVNVVRALELNSKMIAFYPIAEALPKIQADLLKGKKFHESLTEQKLFPPKMVAMLKVGEEVNQMGFFFDKLKEQYQRELESQSSVLGSVLEPIILIVLGGLVALILVAMYMPLFDLNRLF